MEELDCSLPVTKTTSDACPTEDAIRALLENLVDPLLPLKPNDVPSKALRQSVAKQVLSKLPVSLIGFPISSN